MGVSVNIFGLGDVVGIPSDVAVGAEVYVSAVAGDGYALREWSLNGVSIPVSPNSFVFTVGESDELSATFYVSALSYLRSLSDFVLREGSYVAILRDRDVLPEVDALDLPVRLRDLLRADLFMFLSTLPSSRASSEDSDGYWKHRVGGYSLSDSDKGFFRKLANRIYRQYGDERSSPATFRILNL